MRLILLCCLSVVLCAQEITPHVFPVQVQRVVDGDTLDLRIDLGFRLTTERRLRLLGVEAPESRGTEAPAGQVAEAFTARWVANRRLFLVYREEDAFGRVLGELVDDQGQSLARYLIDQRVALPRLRDRPTFTPEFLLEISERTVE